MSNLPERYISNGDINLMARIAKTYSMSGLFDDINGEIQAYVKISAGREYGLMPFQAMNAIDIIKGKPVLNANFLAAKVKSHPHYDYRVQHLDNERAEIAFFQDGIEIGVSKFDQEDAQRAGLAGGRGGMYEKYARNMLFARALSNGVAWFTPDVIAVRSYLEGELEREGTRPQQEGGPTATVPDNDRETIVEAVLVTEDDGTPTPGEAERAIALAIEQEEARRAAFESDDPTVPNPDTGALPDDPVDADDDLPFGNDSPLPPPLSDAQKIDAIGDMFRPASGVALPAAERAKVKKACQALGIWGEQTPRELFRMFGDEAMTLATLKDALAAALEALPKESPAPAAAEPQEPVHAPPSAAEMLRKQEARVAEVVAVLGALSQDQAAIVYAAVPEGLQTPTDIARDLWLSYGLAALGADSLVDAVKAGS